MSSAAAQALFGGPSQRLRPVELHVGPATTDLVETDRCGRSGEVSPANTVECRPLVRTTPSSTKCAASFCHSTVVARAAHTIRPIRCPQVPVHYAVRRHCIDGSLRLRVFCWQGHAWVRYSNLAMRLNRTRTEQVRTSTTETLVRTTM